MIRFVLMAAFIVTGYISPLSARADAVDHAPAGQDTITAVRTAGDSAATTTVPPSPRSTLLMLPDRYYAVNTSLVFSMNRSRPGLQLLGYELYRPSRLRLTMESAGAAASIGLMVGAFGEMTGAWDDDASWMIGGAMAAFGALYGGVLKENDSRLNLRIRWDDGPRGSGVDLRGH